MNMVLFFIISFAVVLFVLARRNERLLFSHIQANYPEEWKKFNVTKMGVKPYEIFPEVLEQSIKQGYLSQQNDFQLLKLHKQFKIFKYLSFALFFTFIFQLSGI